MKILLVDEDKEVSERCRDYLEDRFEDIKVYTENGSANIINKVKENNCNGLISDMDHKGYEKSKLYDILKNSGEDINFILAMDKKNGEGSIELTYYNKIKNRLKLKNDLDKGFDLIDAILDSGKRDSIKDDKNFDLEKTVQLLYDDHVKCILDETNGQFKDMDEILDQNISKVVAYRRVNKLKELDLIEIKQDNEEDIDKSYRSNLDDCRISCKNGIISAKFNLDKDMKKNLQI
ncbi:MAG: hypothetical protein ACOC5D_06885 [Thermoplasmatota archaeon]